MAWGDGEPVGHRQHAERDADQADGDAERQRGGDDGPTARDVRHVAREPSQITASGGTVRNAEAGWPWCGSSSPAHADRGRRPKPVPPK